MIGLQLVLEISVSLGDSDSFVQTFIQSIILADSRLIFPGRSRSHSRFFRRSGRECGRQSALHTSANTVGQRGVTDDINHSICRIACTDMIPTPYLPFIAAFDT